jgi:glycosyltransferase involved in cell wall biosynthesis
MKKVLIITYYWPPSGGSGVQRWLKFVKYLPSHGWEPHVFTPENPSFAVRDPSLENDVPVEAEVIRFPIWEPYDIFFKISGWFGVKKQATPTVVPAANRSAFQSISTWVRGNFFVPDPRRFWVQPSVKFLSDYLASNQIDIVVTTGPPHSMHLIGLRLKSKFPHLRWLADFRDPWTEWGMWDSLMVTKAVRKLHKNMEAKVLAAADDIITITPFYAKRFEHLARRPVTLLTNGFDEEDFAEMRYEKSGFFLIRHVGLINEKCDPRPFMEALKNEMERDQQFAKDVRLEFIGEVHPDFRRYVGQQRAFEDVVLFPGNIPHKELIHLYGSSSSLLLILTGYKDAEGFLPGKLFEYFATGLPVIGVGPVAGDAGRLLKETGAGVMIESADVVGIQKALRDAYKSWQEHSTPRVDLGKVRRFSRKEITGQLAAMLSGVRRTTDEAGTHSPNRKDPWR